jgi:hypothetical protein
MDVVCLGLAHVVTTVIWVLVHGGESGFARSYIPVTPIIYLIAEEVIRMTGNRRAMAAFAAFVIVTTLAASRRSTSRDVRRVRAPDLQRFAVASPGVVAFASNDSKRGSSRRSARSSS